jgi:hypothetical protein
MTAYGVTQAKKKPANQHQAKEDGQQHSVTHREFRVALGVERLKRVVVERSPHAPSS